MNDTNEKDIVQNKRLSIRAKFGLMLLTTLCLSNTLCALATTRFYSDRMPSNDDSKSQDDGDIPDFIVCPDGKTDTITTQEGYSPTRSTIHMVVQGTNNGVFVIKNVEGVMVVESYGPGIQGMNHDSPLMPVSEFISQFGSPTGVDYEIDNNGCVAVDYD